MKRSIISAIAAQIEANPRLLPAFGIIAVLCALLIVRAGYRYHVTAQEEIALNAERYAAFRSVLVRADDLERLRDADEEKTREFEKGLLGADKPATGAARLHEAFKALASRRNVAISSVRPLIPEHTGSYAKVPVEFEVNGTLSNLKDLLYEVRASLVLMGVKSLRIRSDEQGASALDATVVLEGVIKKVNGD